MSTRWYDPAIDAVAATLNGGQIQIRTGAQPAKNAALSGSLLVTLNFADPAFGSSDTGEADAAALDSEDAVFTGTAAYYAMVESDGTTVVGTGTVGATGSGADLELSATAVTAGAPVEVTRFDIFN